MNTKPETLPLDTKAHIPWLEYSGLYYKISLTRDSRGELVSKRGKLQRGMSFLWFWLGHLGLIVHTDSALIKSF